MYVCVYVCTYIRMYVCVYVCSLTDGCNWLPVALSLLTCQVSREIIKRCKVKISLDDIFEGFVERSAAVLHECIACCASWKGTYV